MSDTGDPKPERLLPRRTWPRSPLRDIAHGYAREQVSFEQYRSRRRLMLDEWTGCGAAASANDEVTVKRRIQPAPQPEAESEEVTIRRRTARGTAASAGQASPAQLVAAPETETKPDPGRDTTDQLGAAHRQTTAGPRPRRLGMLLGAGMGVVIAATLALQFGRPGKPQPATPPAEFAGTRSPAPAAMETEVPVELVRLLELLQEDRNWQPETIARLIDEWGRHSAKELDSVRASVAYQEFDHAFDSKVQMTLALAETGSADAKQIRLMREVASVMQLDEVDRSLAGIDGAAVARAEGVPAPDVDEAQAAVAGNESTVAPTSTATSSGSPANMGPQADPVSAGASALTGAQASAAAAAAAPGTSAEPAAMQDSGAIASIPEPPSRPSDTPVASVAATAAQSAAEAVVPSTATGASGNAPPVSEPLAVAEAPVSIAEAEVPAASDSASRSASKAVPGQQPCAKVCRDVLGDGSMGPTLMEIPPGEFLMGSNFSDAERPQHRVVIPRRLAVGQYEITYAEFASYCQATHTPCPVRIWESDNYPVINVSWEQASAYARWLSEETGAKYRLPTEAEWEYAARAGTTGKYPFSDPDDITPADAHYAQTTPMSRDQSRGRINPNRFRLYHMIGNVQEWVADSWRPDYTGAPDNGMAREGDGDRVVRGGAYSETNPELLRVTMRSGLPPNNQNVTTGFRLVRELECSSSHGGGCTHGDGSIPR